MRPETLRFFFVSSVPFLEAFNASRAVDEFLLAGIKRVAFVADIDMRAFDRGTRLDDIAARAGECHRVVFRMDFVFHNRPLMKINSVNFDPTK
jgi:hypothetical protein